jgi:hypothetical protein
METYADRSMNLADASLIVAAKELKTGKGLHRGPRRLPSVPVLGLVL